MSERGSWFAEYRGLSLKMKSRLLNCGMVLNMLCISWCKPRHQYSLTHSPLGSDILLRSQNKADECWTLLPAAELGWVGNVSPLPMKASARAPGVLPPCSPSAAPQAATCLPSILFKQAHSQT